MGGQKGSIVICYFGSDYMDYLHSYCPQYEIRVFMIEPTKKSILITTYDKHSPSDF